MKLNPECLRDMLIIIQEKTGIDDNGDTVSISFDSLCNCMDSYNKGDIVFTLLRLFDEDLVSGRFQPADKTPIYSARIDRLTPEGEKLLTDISDSGKWNAIKKKFKDKGIPTLTAIIEIVKSFI
ncbi:MAG: DUF2513 domain-containing protein [Ruminococcus sp.]|nr:DUF2513 domain-containing protein [Ruminococcus sp.]